MALANMDGAAAFWRGKRVLVTGHTGFKGSWLVVWLASLGAEIHGVSLEAAPGSMFERLALRERVHHTVADVRDLGAMKAVFRDARPECVFHLAAQSLVRESYVSPVETYATNVQGTVHVLEAARSAPGLRSIVCVTSDKCYENREWPWGYRESDAMGGFDPYSSSKGCAELVVSAYRRSFFMKEGDPTLASARAGNVIGGGDWSADRLVPNAMRALSCGASVGIRNPTSIRPWQHVIDPLRGYLMLAQACHADRSFGDGWNFGPSEEDCVPVGTLMDGLVAAWGTGASWSHAHTEHAPHEARMLRLDCSKARAALGWAPRVRLAAALKLTAEWYRAEADGASARELHDLSVRQLQA